MKPLAPFGKEVVKEIRAGKDPDVHLFANPDGWSAARHRIERCGRGTAMVLPVGDDPASYRWPRLSYPTVVITGLDGDAVRHLVAVLIASGIEHVALCDACNGSRSAIVKASAIREAA